MAIAYSITVCLLLLTWTAVASSSDANMGCMEQIDHCGSQAHRLFTERNPQTMPEYRTMFVGIGVDEICRLLGDAFDCMDSVLAIPRCTHFESMFSGLIPDLQEVFDYMCNQEGKELLLASLDSPCFTREEISDIYIQQVSMCFATFNSEPESTESANAMPSDIFCPRIPALADCMVNAGRDTCGADYGQLMEGLRPYWIARSRSEVRCHLQDNRTFRNLVSRALRGFNFK